MSIKFEIEAHEAARLLLSQRIHAIGDQKLIRFFNEETECLEKIRAEFLSLSATLDAMQEDISPVLNLPKRGKAKSAEDLLSGSDGGIDVSV